MAVIASAVYAFNLLRSVARSPDPFAELKREIFRCTGKFTDHKRLQRSPRLIIDS